MSDSTGLGQLGQMLVGTSALASEPGVTLALANAQASPSDAQSVDQFMQGLQAEQLVQTAQATGTAIKLTPIQKLMLQQNGVDYSGVEFSSADAITAAQKRIEQQTNGQYTAQLDANGKLALDAKGNVVQQKVSHDDGGGGFLGWLGSVASGAKHYIWDDAVSKVADPVLNVVSKGYNLAQYGLSSIVTGGGDSHDEDMRALGYDPTSFWSRLAYASSGKAHTSLDDLNGQYGADKVQEAVTYLNDPAQGNKALLANPSFYTTSADGHTTLTAEGEKKIAYLQSDDFKKLAMKLGASSATLGNDLANAIGIDPINHPDAYKWTTVASNIAASFLIDPTLWALKGVSAIRAARIGMSSLADADRAVQILGGANKVSAGWQRGIDLARQIRTARDAGDATTVLATSARFRAELPDLAPIMDDFVGGGHSFLGFKGEEVINGKTVPIPQFGESNGFHSLADAQDYVGSKLGLVRLMNGSAARQASLMPGALSAFGVKKVRGAIVEAMTTSAAGRMSEAYGKVLSKAEADPFYARKLIDEGTLQRMLPEPNDAVQFRDGVVLGAKSVQPGGLASEERGTYALSSKGMGDVQYNLRSTGDPVADSTSRIAAAVERGRLAATRLSMTLLPRNVSLDINDAQSSEKVYQFARTYLSRADANVMRTAYQMGDSSVRKTVIEGLIDQVGHAAGLTKSESGQQLLDKAKTVEQAYNTAGEDLLLNGKKVALFEGQTRLRWTLPSFRDLKANAAKAGLWDAVLGRPFTAHQADTAMAVWKFGALLRPATVTRNQTEGWLRTALEGRAGDALKARAFATAKNRELWDRGIITADKTAYDAAVAAGDKETAANIANRSMLSGQVLGRSKTGTRLADLAPFAVAGRAYRALYGMHMDEATLDALSKMPAADLTEFVEGYHNQLMAAEMGRAGAAADATKVAAGGFGPVASSFKQAVHGASEKGRAAAESAGQTTTWSHEAVDGTIGADKYATALHQRVDAMPETARAAIAIIEGGSSDLRPLMDALRAESRNTAFGKVYLDPATGTARNAVDTIERTQGEHDWAQLVVNEYRHLLTGQNDKVASEITDFIKANGRAPDGEWIHSHVKGDNLPESVLAPSVVAMPNGGIRSLAQTLMDPLGGAYQWLVERPLQRTTSSPVMLANYAKIRAGMDSAGGVVEKLVKQGISPEAAGNLAHEVSMKNAWIKTEQMIDDPGQLTQFDVVARNIFPFARATNAMIRRWGTGLWQNPVGARKLMLAYEGAVHSGMVYTNEYGEPTFTYPLSGAFGEGLQELSKVPGFGGIAQFPVSASMTGGVLLAVPGADNPLRMGMGPMAAITFREVYKHLLPDAWRGDAEKLDATLNGPVGVGETWTTLLPTVARQYYKDLGTDDRNSAIASATNGAIATLMAAGLAPGQDASPAELQAFRNRVQTQVRNQMYVRFALGLFAPAAPSSPTEDTSTADFAWSTEGARGLSDEYKRILNEVNGDVGKANAVFTAMHPDDVNHVTGVSKLPSAYTTSMSHATASGAYLPPTEKALSWMENNSDFVSKYGPVAAYFLPEAAKTGAFSDAAYRAQIEFGLRQKKTPQEFMNEVYTKHAESVFFPMTKYYDQQIAVAKANGDTATASQWTQAKSTWESEYKQLNPVFGQKFDQYGDARSKAVQQVADLTNMVERGEVPDGTGPQVAQLLTVYNRYQAYVQTVPGQTDAAIQARSDALAQLNAWADQNITGTTLEPLWNGVFRVLNTNLVTLKAAT